MTTEQLEEIIERALAEDLPDITTDAIFDAGERGEAYFLAKAPGVVAGLAGARAVFATLDAESAFTAVKRDGDRIEQGETIARVSGSVRALLSGERTALNLVQRASGIATLTSRFVLTLKQSFPFAFSTREYLGSTWGRSFSRSEARALDCYVAETT